MTTKHTAGPWILVEGDRFESDVVITTAIRFDESMHSIAEVETDWDEPFSSEQRANARLIAAAPDLLSALNRANTLLSELNFSEWIPKKDFQSIDIRQRIKATHSVVSSAIAKATGN